MTKLDAIMETYDTLARYCEVLSVEMSRLDVKRKKLEKKRRKAYEKMDLLKQELKALMGEHDEKDGDLNPPPTAELKPVRKRARVDVDQAKALREAGWSYSKIADEMGVSAQSVQSALSRAKKLELTEEEKAGCDRLAEELMGR